MLTMLTDRRTIHTRSERIKKSSHSYFEYNFVTLHRTKFFYHRIFVYYFLHLIRRMLSGWYSVQEIMLCIVQISNIQLMLLTTINSRLKKEHEEEKTQQQPKTMEYCIRNFRFQTKCFKITYRYLSVFISSF